MKKNYDVKIIESIIYRFSENNYGTLIKPREVFDFAFELYEKGEIPYKLSYDFWRKPKYLGKQLIEKTNKVLEISKIDVELELLSENEGYSGVISEKNELLVLKMELDEYKEKINDLEEIITNLEGDLNFINIRNDKYKKTIFSIIAASTYSNDPFFDFLKGNVIENPIVEALFNNIFSDEKNMETEFLNYIHLLINENNKSSNSEVININESRISKLLKANKMKE